MRQVKPLMTFLFILSTIWSISQPVYSEKIESKESDENSDYVVTNIIGQIKNDYYVYSTKNKKTYVEKWDTRLNFKVATDIATYKKNSSTVQTSSAIILNDKLFILSQSYDKTKKESTYSIQELDLKDLKPLGDEKVLSTVTVPETENRMMGAVNGFGIGNVMKEMRQFSINMNNMFIVSPDKTKALIYNSPSINDRKNPDVISALVFDSEMNMIWTNSEIHLTVLSTDFDISKIKLSNEGDIYISGIEYVNKKTRKAGLAFDYYNHLYSITNKGTEVHDYLLNEKIGFIYAFDFNFDSNNNIKLGGYYSTKGRDYLDGIFIAEINPSKKTYTFTEKNEIVFDFVKYGKGKKPVAASGDVNPKLKGFDYVIDNIFVHDDGSLTMVAEKILTNETHLLGNYRSPFTINLIYSYEDIIISKFTAKGKYTSNTFINKNHNTIMPTTGYNYTIGFKNNDIYILHCDNTDNYDQTEASKFESLNAGKNGYNMIISKITPDGKEHREIVEKIDSKSDMFPTYYTTVNSTGFMVLEKEDATLGSSSSYLLTLLKF